MMVMGDGDGKRPRSVSSVCAIYVYCELSGSWVTTVCFVSLCGRLAPVSRRVGKCIEVYTAVGSSRRQCREWCDVFPPARTLSDYSKQ